MYRLRLTENADGYQVVWFIDKETGEVKFTGRPDETIIEPVDRQMHKARIHLISWGRDD